MFENSNPYLAAEMEYRSNRIKSGIVRRRRRADVRTPLVRRPTDPSGPRTSTS